MTTMRSIRALAAIITCAWLLSGARQEETACPSTPQG